MAAVAQITTYQELQDHIANTLIRSDLTTVITSFIQLAEAGFKRDKRFRKLTDRGNFSVSADGSTLPSDFQSLESWYHNGPTFYGPIKVVNSDMIGHLKGNKFGGVPGTPAFASIVDGTARYAPEPNDTFITQMLYWRKVAPLSTTNTTNWLLDDHPDIYVYGSLVHSAPYLKDDNRLPMWQELLNAAVEQLDDATEEEMFSGTLHRSIPRPIGG